MTLEKRNTKTQTEVRVITRADVRNVINTVDMTQEEERFLRLRYGVSEGPEAPIVRRGQENMETRAKLALIEASMLPAGLSQVNEAVKSRIIRRLQELD